MYTITKFIDNINAYNTIKIISNVKINTFIGIKLISKIVCQ